MDQVQSANEIDEEAIEWAVRRETRDDPAFEAELQTWLADDPRRVGAFVRAEAGLSYMRRARALRDGAGVAAARGPSRRAIAVGGAAALAAGLAGVWVTFAGDKSYGTQMGEVRRVRLPDGSSVTLNTESQITVSMRRDLRRVTLNKGEAWFKVAKDAQRPFVVEAGDARVRAVGTAFSVRRQDMSADTIVTEGVVEAWSIDQKQARLPIRAGSAASVARGQGAVLVRIDGDVNDALAWRVGQIALHGATLAYAAAEFNRYNARKIIIADPGLAAERVIGQFSADDPEGFAKAAAATVGARVAVEPGSLRLYRTDGP